MKPPAFQFYPDDFVAGVATMNQAEVGAYILLLCHQWSAGKIPDGLARLELVAKGKVSQHVLDKFPLKKNKRLEAERRKQNEYRKNRSESGRNGANKRWHSHSTAIGTAIVLPMAKNSSPSPSPSPIHKDPTKLPPSVRNGSFSKAQAALVLRFDQTLAEEWENDRQKWMGRIKHDSQKAERVLAEVENAKKEGRINTTPARYAEQQWKEFA